VQVQTDLQATGSPSAPLDDPRGTVLRSKAADERADLPIAPRRSGLTIQRATAARSGQSVRLRCASIQDDQDQAKPEAGGSSERFG
jgi:hypothetical protein